MIVRPSNNGAKNVTGSAKSLPQPGRSAIGMFFDGVWIVGYAPLIWRTLKVIPIFFASCWIVATMPGSTPRVSETSNTFLHALASHMPLEPVEYFDPFIAAFAFATSPWSPAVLYGANSASWLLKSVSGTMWFAIFPIVGPPQALISDGLSMIQFIAFRTWMSSNGAWVAFIVMYQVRSPEFWC